MQQISMLLDINELPPIDKLDPEDSRQLETIIDLCRVSDRPDLAAPYAAYLCKESSYDELPYEIWFDAIREDDLFLVKAIVASGFDINETYEQCDDGSEFGAAITDAIAYNSKNVLSFLLERPELDIDVVGFTLSDYEHPTLANPVPTNKYVVPFLRLYRSEFSSRLEKLKFDIDIRWGRHDDKSALIMAVEKNDFELTEWLLKHKSNTNQPSKENDHETLFGWLVNDYIQEPTPDKFKLVKLMIEHGASILADDWEGFPIYLSVWRSKDQNLINLFQLYHLQEELEEQNEIMEALNERCREVELRDKNGINNAIRDIRNSAININDNAGVSPPTLEVSILTELRILGPFPPGPWITDIKVKQAKGSLRLIICHDESSPIQTTEVILPDELAHNATPDELAYYGCPSYTSCLDMILTLTSRNGEWWIKVEDYIHRFGVALFDEYFYKRKLTEFNDSDYL